MLFTVYDLKGECFEVSPHLAKILIIEYGWSINPPSIEQYENIAEEQEPLNNTKNESVSLSLNKKP